MKSNIFAAHQIQKMYDFFSSMPWFWEIDAITCRATENSPYRDQAIKLLELVSTHRVLDVACGTGLNFMLIQKHLRNRGNLIGIDLSAKTLNLARKRIEKNNWKNIELIQTDSASYQSEVLFDAALCTFAIEIIPPYRQTIDMMIRVVKPGGRIAIIGFKQSSWDYFKLFNSIFKGVSVVFGGIDMNRNVREYICANCREIFYKEVYGGFYYILVVQKMD
jgi:ubiquinone/menaquinone biosynthesis C-methylase UbiE